MITATKTPTFANAKPVDMHCKAYRKARNPANEKIAKLALAMIIQWILGPDCFLCLLALAILHLM